MDYSIQAEYGSLLAREQFIRVQLNELPIGYISKKRSRAIHNIIFNAGSEKR